MPEDRPPEIPFYTWADGSRHASPERKPASLYDNDGVDRQTYEDPVCNQRTTPHDPHFHTVMRGLTLNCPGLAEPPRTSISLSDLEDALAGLDIYKPGLSYAETAEVIINYRKDNHA